MSKELKDQICYICGNTFQGADPDTCCSGNMCGCMGMPTNPGQIVCSIECYDKLMKPDEGHNDPLQMREY